MFLLRLRVFLFFRDATTDLRSEERGGLLQDVEAWGDAPTAAEVGWGEAPEASWALPGLSEALRSVGCEDLVRELGRWAEESGAVSVEEAGKGNGRRVGEVIENLDMAIQEAISIEKA